MNSPSDNTSAKRRLPRIWRILIWVVVLGAVAGGGTALYTWRLKIKAAQVYELGSGLNSFLANYSTALKERNVDAIVDLYDERYSSPREGTWTEKLAWENEKDADDRARLRVFTLEESDTHQFSRSDVRKQVETQLASMEKVNFAKFKIERIEDQKGVKSARLKVMMWLRGTEQGGQTVETHAYIRLWLVQEHGWKIQRKELINGNTVRGTGHGFTEVTAQAGIDFKAHHNPMLKEAKWYPKKFEIMKYAHGGLAVADYDGDGWDDIYLCDGERPRLYRNLRDFTFEDVTSKAGLPDIEMAVHAAIFADFDNDGDLDLFLGRATADNKLYRNNGDGTFTDVSATANLGRHWVSVAAAADYNNDGRIDLYVGRYLDPTKNLPTTLFYTRNGEGNTLLRNEGNLTFTDVTDTAGVREGGLTLGVAWGDYNGDGNLDLYVANDFGRKALFKNNGDGTFADVSKASGTLDFGYGMSSTFGDMDNDGDLDLYVANVHSGQRWFGNEATLKNYIATSLKQGTMGEDRALFEEMYKLIDGDWLTFGDRVIRGNSLMLNNGDGTFTDVTESSGVNPHGWFWGSINFDYDNDGWQDIYAVDGWITGDKSVDI